MWREDGRLDVLVIITSSTPMQRYSVVDTDHWMQTSGCLTIAGRGMTCTKASFPFGKLILQPKKVVIASNHFIQK